VIRERVILGYSGDCCTRPGDEGDSDARVGSAPVVSGDWWTQADKRKQTTKQCKPVSEQLTGWAAVTASGSLLVMGQGGRVHARVPNHFRPGVAVACSIHIFASILESKQRISASGPNDAGQGRRNSGRDWRCKHPDSCSFTRLPVAIYLGTEREDELAYSDLPVLRQRRSCCKCIFEQACLRTRTHSSQDPASSRILTLGTRSAVPSTSWTPSFASPTRPAPRSPRPHR
jgi:hypothetical protein